MLALSIDSFDVELTEGSIRNVGAPTKSATAKLFHPTEVEGRTFGDSQVKLVAVDDDGNEVQVALDAGQADALADSLAARVDELD